MAKRTTKTESKVNSVNVIYFDFIEAKLEAGLGHDEIKVALFSEFSEVSLNKAGALFNEYLKANNLAVKKVGFTAMYYDFLKAGIRSEGECDEFMKAHGSENVLRHRTHYQAVRELTNAIHESK